MKILTTVKSTGRAEEMAHTTFRWAARAGQDIRIFVPKKELKAYQAAVDDANYHYYLVSRDEKEIVVSIGNQSPMRYARDNGYDLIVELPDNLLDYSEEQNDDKGVIDFATEVGIARKEISANPKLDRYLLKHGCVVRRVK